MKNYDNFFFPIDDMKKAKDYYENVLKLKVKFNFEDEGMIGYSVGKEEAAIVLKDKNKFKNLKPTIWIEVHDVQKEFKELKAKGVKFLGDPFRIKTGFAVEFEDPFGNRLGIVDYKS